MIKKLQEHFLTVLIIAALSAVAISFAIGYNQGVWFDEGYSIIIAKQSTAKMIQLTSVDVHPPLYYLLLQAWGHVLNNWGVVLRLLSSIFLGVAVFISGLLAKKLFNKRTAIITLPFVVFCPMLLRYGFEIRMYSLTALIGTAATYVLACAIGATKRRQKYLFGIYAVLVAAGMYTHYYMALLWIGHLAWLIWDAHKNKKPILRSRWLLAYLISILLYIPWMPSFLHQFMGGVLASVVQPMTVNNLLGIISFNFVFKPVWQLDGIASLIIILACSAIVTFAIKAYKRFNDKEKAKYQFLIFSFAVPVIVLTIVGIFRPMYLERYMLPFLMGGIISVGASIAKVTERKKIKYKIMAFGIFAMMLIGVVELINVGNFSFQRLENVRTIQAANSVDTSDCVHGNTAIIAADPYTYVQFDNFFDKTGCPYYFYSDEVKLGGGYAILSGSKWRADDPAKQLEKYSKIYYIYYDQPKLVMPADTKLVSSEKYGSVTVDCYTK